MKNRKENESKIYPCTLDHVHPMYTIVHGAENVSMNRVITKKYTR